VHPEIEALRTKLKELLYDCAIEIRATKAALFLAAGGGKYELVAEYGFRSTIRQTADANDPVIDRAGRARTPFFVNGLTAEPRFSEVLYEASTDRLLAAPVYLRGELVGVIDMRDKAAKAPFEQTDVPKAQRIADRIAALFVNRNVFGQRFIALSDADGQAHVTRGTAPIDGGPGRAPAEGAPKTQAAPAPAAAPPLAAPSVRSAPPSGPLAGDAIAEARNAANRILLPPAGESLGEPELLAVRDALRKILIIPGVVAATFSAYGHMGGVQEIAGRSTLTEDAQMLLQSKLTAWLSRRGEAEGFLKTNLFTPFGTSTPPVTASQMQRVFTAPVQAGALRSMYLTVAFSEPPDRVTHELLAADLADLQVAIEASQQRVALQNVRARIAEKLVEPDFLRFPELRHHSDSVVALSERFARNLTLPAPEVETLRLVAIVHDAGMRLLDYEALYRKRGLDAGEKALLREHAAVGAALVEPLLGHEVARAVLCHHERADGRGYPNALQGDAIPYVSRVLQICDAFVAMTDSRSYQPPVSRAQALATIASGGGQQFDEELTRRFVEMMRTEPAG
jgi:hypothetical protein